MPAAGNRPRLPADGLSLLVWLLLATCATLLRGHRQRLRAVLLVGLIGRVVALTFAALSAHDLALTQLSVELVSTVLLLMGLALLPPFSSTVSPTVSPKTSPTVSPKASHLASHTASSRWRSLRDGLRAAAGGLGLAGLSWLVMTREPQSISGYFLGRTLPQGGGSNVVNVILVDFRGYDTFGEITVLAIAALGALALLDGWRVRRPGADVAGRAWTFARPSLMLRRVARLVLPLPLPLPLVLVLVLVLTAIVIGLATTRLLIELALRSSHDNGSDHVDGREPGPRPTAAPTPAPATPEPKP